MREKGGEGHPPLCKRKSVKPLEQLKKAWEACFRAANFPWLIAFIIHKIKGEIAGFLLPRMSPTNRKKKKNTKRRRTHKKNTKIDFVFDFWFAVSPANYPMAISFLPCKQLSHDPSV